MTRAFLTHLRRAARTGDFWAGLLVLPAMIATLTAWAVLFQAISGGAS